VSSFGAQLKQEREKQGVSLEDISLSTKIGTRMLRALEEEHFDQLPGGIFNKGFIRAYARCLGIDEEQAIADYLAATGASPAARKLENDQTPDLSPVIEPPPREPSKSPGLPWGTLAVALLIVALGFAGWGFYSREPEKAAPDSTPPAANSPSPQPAVAAAQPPPEPKSAEPAPTTRKPVDQKVAPPTADQPASAQAASAQAASAATPKPTVDQPQPAVPTNGTFLLVIKAREDSWLSISVDGEIVTRSLLAAPAQKSVRAHDEMVIRAGNVGALDFEFNGTKLPTQGGLGEAKTLTFDPNGLRSPAPKPETPAPMQ
jgi:cytoskeleton protein RodZ